MLILKTAGESHGKAVIAYIEGLPAGIEIDYSEIENELRRRKLGFGRGERSKIEEDRFEILSGIFKNKTTGMPLVIAVFNSEYEKWKKYYEGEEENKKLDRMTPRPGHADYAGWVKFGYESIRPVIERSSARHTAAYVAAGAIFKSFLKKFGIKIYSFLRSAGGEIFEVPDRISEEDLRIAHESEFHLLDKRDEEKLKRIVSEAEKKGTTLGGSVTVVGMNVFPGLGSYSDYDKRIDSRLAAVFMAIPSVKALEIGKGFESSKKFGNEVLDEFDVKDGYVSRKTNFAGGIEGGITNGEPIVATIYFKPVPTQKNPLKSFNIETYEEDYAFYERSDVFVGRAIGVIAESLMAYVISQAILETFGGDNLEEVLAGFKNFQKRLRWKPKKELQL